ncbi:MAG: hypothetical protein QXF12_04305 [Candidatus Aenigmatarchaeota archaeon]
MEAIFEIKHKIEENRIIETYIAVHKQTGFEIGKRIRIHPRLTISCINVPEFRITSDGLFLFLLGDDYSIREGNFVMSNLNTAKDAHKISNAINELIQYLEPHILSLEIRPLKFTVKTTPPAVKIGNDIINITWIGSNNDVGIARFSNKSDFCVPVKLDLKVIYDPHPYKPSEIKINEGVFIKRNTNNFLIYNKPEEQFLANSELIIPEVKIHFKIDKEEDND